MALSEGQKIHIRHCVGETIKQAREQRYPVVLVVARGEQCEVGLWQEIAEAEGLAYGDFLELIEEPELRSAMAVWPKLIDWIRSWALKQGGALFVEVDALVTRWSESDRQRFFLKLLKSQTYQSGSYEPVPMVLVSRLAGSVKLPPDTREYGIVLYLNE